MFWGNGNVPFVQITAAKLKSTEQKLANAKKENQVNEKNIARNRIDLRTTFILFRKYFYKSLFWGNGNVPFVQITAKLESTEQQLANANKVT